RSEPVKPCATTSPTSPDVPRHRRETGPTRETARRIDAMKHTWAIVAAALVLPGRAAAQSTDSPPTEDRAPRITDAELAGRPLAAFPRFEYVNTFHQGDGVSTALDPFSIPEIVGVMADFYVTSDRDAAQWSSNPTLVDVRGTPITATFGVSGVPSCTI